MSREGYLALSIVTLVLLGLLALGLFLLLRKGPKVERPRCVNCEAADCPIARKHHKEEER